MIHYHQHIAQLQEKKLQQAVIEQAVQAVSQIAQQGAAAGGGPGSLPGGTFRRDQSDGPAQQPGSGRSRDLFRPSRSDA